MVTSSSWGVSRNILNKGGEKISPVEIDNMVAHYPVVGEAVSFAIADEMYGQDIRLAIVWKDWKQIGADELQKWIASKVAKAKVPKQVRGSLPYDWSWDDKSRYSSPNICQRHRQVKCSGGSLQKLCSSIRKRRPSSDLLSTLFLCIGEL